MTNESLKDNYKQLLALTQLYLLQEHSPQERIFSESESYLYFRELAIKQQKPQQRPAVHVENANQHATPRRKEAEPPREPVEKIVLTPILPSRVEPIPTPKIVESSTEIEEITIEKVAPLPLRLEPEKEIPTIIEVKAVDRLGFELQPISAPVRADLSEVRSLIAQHFPNLPILERIPDDSLAKQQMNHWKKEAQTPAILILSFGESEKQLAFLKNVAKALHICLGPTQLLSAEKIEAEQGWNSILQSPALRLVITSDYGIYSLPELMKHYKEDSRYNKRHLDKVPLFLLPDISVYLKEPLLKNSLWQSLCKAYT